MVLYIILIIDFAVFYQSKQKQKEEIHMFFFFSPCLFRYSKKQGLGWNQTLERLTRQNASAGYRNERGRAGLIPEEGEKEEGG